MFKYAWRQSLCWWLLFAAGLLVVYGPALHGGFLFDDDVHISKNEVLHSATGLGRIWAEPGATCQYYPLTFSAFWLEYHLWGLDPLGYHVINVLMHAGVAVLLGQILRRLRVPGAMLAAALFALHPVMVMSVAWMTELKNTLSAALALGAIWSYLRFARVGVYADDPAGPGGGKRERVGGGGGRWRWYLLALGFFQLAMFAKTAVSFVPATLMLILWWRQPRLRWADLPPLLPMLAVVVVMGRITAAVERATGATGSGYSQTLMERVLISGRSFWFYLGRLVWPADLMFIYPRWDVNPAVWWQWLFPLATGLTLAGLWMVRARLGKALLAATLHFFLCTSALILGLTLYFTRYSFVSDHWQYFGALGLAALAGAGLARGQGALTPGPPVRRSLGVAAVVLLLAGLAGATWRRCHVYSSDEALWRATLAENPGCPLAHNNLGMAFLAANQPHEAAAQFEEALRFDPNYGLAHNNLGMVLLAANQPRDAAAHFEEAVRLEPNSGLAHINLGLVLYQGGQLGAALDQYQAALRLAPDDVMAGGNLVVLLLTMNRPAEALAPAVHLVDLAPDDPVLQFNLGNVLLALGRPAEAVLRYTAALRLRPDYAEAHTNLGAALLQLGRLADAVPQFAAVARLQPGDVAARHNFGLVLAQAGRLPEALAELEEAQRLRPGDPGVQAAIEAVQARLAEGKKG